MAYLDYSEERLIGELERLRVQFRVVYAAACAERLFPAYERYLEQAGRKLDHNLKGLLEKLWLDISGEAMSDSEIDDGIDKCMTEIQDINDSEWIDEAAEGAASSLCYALRCRKSGEAQEAAWATQPLYDTLDHFVINEENIDINQPVAEGKVQAHPVIQAELGRQQRDLEELLDSDNEDISDLVVRLRERAKADAQIFFGSH
jgi:uncharacterized protein YjaG (DUF416 family)